MLLVDQNLPLALAEALRPTLPGTVHLKELHMTRATDSAVWAYALEKRLAIVTKDSDFYDRLTLNGFPPKLIWVRTGNVSTSYLLKLFQGNLEPIRDFIQNPELGYLEIL